MGIRGFGSFNLALLAKLAWKLVNDPSSLFTTTLLAKYCHQKSFLSCSLKNGDSWTWKGILRGRDILVKGLARSIGDEKSIHIWNELWAGSRDTRLIPPVSSSMSNKDFDSFNVSLLLEPITKQWGFDKVQEYINPHYWQSVLATPVS